MTAVAMRRVGVLAVLSMQVWLSTGPAQAAPGDLDPAFGGDGKVLTDVTADPDRATGMAVQPDSKLVVVGATGIARYNRDGSLDPAFGGDGTVQEPVIRAMDVAIQPGGKIVVAGQEAEPPVNPDISQGLAVARYNTNGTLDTGFGTGGKVVSDFPSPSPPESLSATAHRVVLQPDGKILAAGLAQVTAFGSTNSALALARYDRNGVPDTGFGDGGRQVVGLGASFSPPSVSVALQGDGRIVLASTDSGGDFYVVRLVADGTTFDPSFSGTGQVRTNFAPGGSADVANDVTIQSGGKIVVAGTTGDPETFERDFALARYDVNGALDTSFGGDGKVVTDFGEADITDPKPDESIHRLVVQGDGKILAAGCAASSDRCGATGDFGLARYNRGGGLDTGFGDAGRVTTPFADGLDAANDVAIQPDGLSLLAAGEASTGTGDFALARYVVAVPAPVPSKRVTYPTPSPARNRVINGTAGNDVLHGTAGDDVISCGAGNDVVRGSGGDDVINCGSGNDRVDGGAGNDRVDGGSGVDVLKGGSGNDRLAGASGKDRLSGGSGNDPLSGGAGNDRLAGGSGHDRLTGGSGNDVLSGNGGEDVLSGGPGRDRLSGGAEDDRLSGGSGSDRLAGGRGRDRLVGGPGRDRTRQ